MQHNHFSTGGTEITLRYGEYRESVDVGFLVQALAAYRSLRNSVREQGLQALMRSADYSQLQIPDIRGYPSGIRAKAFVEGKSINFQVALDGRIGLAEPAQKDRILRVATLAKLEIAESKLRANSDRCLDTGAHCQGVIGIAMLDLSKSKFAEATTKSKAAYGKVTLKELSKVIGGL